MHSSQFRYAMVYVFITAAVLCFLNIQSSVTNRNMTFQAKHTSMQTKCQMIVSALSSVDKLTADQVSQVVTLLRGVDASRILVTDHEGTALYDSATEGNVEGKAVLFSEVQQAILGNDVFYATYTPQMLESRMCIPVYSQTTVIGAVCLLEYDAEQGALIHALETNILQTSLVLAGVIIAFSILFSLKFSYRMRRILRSIQRLGDGEFGNHLDDKGHDEVSVLATEFNKMTARLQDAELAQRQFVSDASHELKTPLASIKLLSDSILQNQMDIETAREFVEDIGNEADRLTRLAQKLLELNRGETPRDDLMVVETGAIVEMVLRMLRPTASVKQIDLVGQLEYGCTMVTHEDDFYQVVFNLVENAIKYTNVGGHVSVSLIREEEELVLMVKDTGMGIPEEAIEHVFDRFYRVDKARSRQAGGNGLGLSIVRDMVERNFGSVSVVSKVDEGSCFTVRFPYFGREDAWV